MDETSMPSDEPRIIERDEQPYVSIRRLVAMTSISEAADELPGLFGWLTARNITPASAPFLKYNVIGSSGTLDVEAGFPVDAPVTGDDRVLAGVLPGGRFATVTHYGHPSKLVDATAALLDWGSDQGLVWDMSETDGGQRWGLRLELYHTNPADQPDPETWETEILFRLASPSRQQ
jgi:effector-binding domain-containing protein